MAFVTMNKYLNTQIKIPHTPLLVTPHGGSLNPLLIEKSGETEHLITLAKSLTNVVLTSKEVSDLIMLGMGAFSPLEGFMKKGDYDGVVGKMHLLNGVLWPIPITLAVSKEQADTLKQGQSVSLYDADSDNVMAIMLIEEKYTYDKAKEAIAVFGTDDMKHPGVKKVYDQGQIYLGGPVQVLSEGDYPAKFPEFARPAETRKLFEERGWKTIAAFQTRNPMHRSHEYLTKIAMEICDGVFIHPVVGKLKTGDIPAHIRMKCYNALLDKYYPKEHVILKVYPMEMRYGGPREAILHAIIRQNFGCSHLIIGRDHAGVGNYYGPFDAQNIFDELEPEALEIKPLKLDWTFWCYKCGEMASMNTCPHSKEDHCLISGTQLRKMLSDGHEVLAEFSRPEVLKILKEYYKNQKDS